MRGEGGRERAGAGFVTGESRERDRIVEGALEIAFG